MVIYKKFTFTIEIFFVLVYNNKYIGFLCPDSFYINKGIVKHLTDVIFSAVPGKGL